MRYFSLLSVCVVSFILSACVMGGGEDRRVSDGSPFDPYNNTIITDGESLQTIQGDGNRLFQTGVQGQSTQQSQVQGKVALLLPLSGQHSKIGQALLQSAQLALFDMNQTGVELLPLDTKGTAAGASAAVIQASQQGAKIILGPLFADAVAAAGASARQNRLNVIGFTTDWNKAGGNVFTLGILPFDQGARLAHHVGKTNQKRVVVLAPNTKYANAVVASFEQSARPYGVSMVQRIQIGSDAQNIKAIVQQLATQSTQFDAILMPVGNPTLPLLASALNDNGLTASTKLWLGTGTWDDDVIKRNPVMKNAFYAAPSPDLRRNFERNYQSLYGVKPPRLASLSYDATALAITLLSQGRGIQPSSIVNPNGFSGIDGIFRFQSNGLAQRGLAIHKITSGRSMIVSQAPNSFVTSRGDLVSR